MQTRATVFPLCLFARLMTDIGSKHGTNAMISRFIQTGAGSVSKKDAAGLEHEVVMFKCLASVHVILIIIVTVVVFVAAAAFCACEHQVVNTRHIYICIHLCLAH